MSRIGRMPISIPAGVDVKIEAGNLVTVKGALGTLYGNLVTVKGPKGTLYGNQEIGRAHV